MPVSPRGLAVAKDAELAARRDREAGEGGSITFTDGIMDDYDDHDDENDDDDGEVTTRVFEVELSSGSSPWATAFLECASEGDVSTLTTLLDDGKVELNDVDVDGFTALMIAAAEAQHDVAMELLRRGADVSIRTHEMRSTALHFAAKSGAAQVVAVICQQDPACIDAQNLDGDTPLVWACTEGRVDAVRVLLHHHANVNVVSHRAMSALICAVMLRESDGSDDDFSDGEEIAATDADRAEIVRLLLNKNPKLVNYQDRDYSTAMHLAASHGYLQCVEALIEFGADITLRNAIGQTPLEEAEATGLKFKSNACVAYLRKIWKQLEEEASARMMAMLEMEESSITPQASGSGTRSAKKTSKKKQKKAKQRRFSKLNASNSPIAEKAIDDKAAGSSGEGSSDEEDEPSERKEDVRQEVDSAVASTPPPSENEETRSDEQTAAEQKAETPHDGGVWTTVGRKHNQYLSQRAATASALEAGTDQVAIIKSVSAALGSEAAPPLSTKVVPVSPRAKSSHLGTETANVGHASKSVSAAKQIPPIQTKRSVHPTAGTSSGGATGVSPTTHPPPPSLVPPLEVASLAKALPVNSPYSTFQRLHNTSRLYERYDRLPDAAADARGSSATGGVDSSCSSSMWRGSTTNSRSLYTPFSLGAGFSSHPSTLGDASISSPAAIWRYTSPAPPQAYDRSPAFSSKRLAPTDRMESKSQYTASESILRSLSCGLCNELVSDNLQCNSDNPALPTAGAKATPCIQLYCTTCLTRASGSVERAAFQCVTCNRPLHVRELKRNDFAEVQAAAMTRASRSHGARHLKPQQHDPYDHMRSLMHSTSDRVHATNIDPFFLVPNANLSAMSVGQLDALEELHLAALQQITQARVENARVLERLRIEEWLKTQRDVLQFASHTSSSS